MNFDGRLTGGIGIQVEGLTKSFGPQRIWEDVTFEIPAGEVSVLLGPRVPVSRCS
jgi:ABC-type transporter Mla maintaining outer membrane lipid asymmetry ATPase subunit MlaF